MGSFIYRVEWNIRVQRGRSRVDWDGRDECTEDWRLQAGKEVSGALRRGE